MSGSSSIEISQLQTTFKGDLITPESSVYDDSRAPFYPWIDSHPDLILYATDVEDVVVAVNLARESALPLAVRGGGHGSHSLKDGGLLLDLSGLNSFELDVENRTLWVGAGLTAGDITKKLTAHKLVVGFGDTASVGISGLTLGGGIGYLSRKYGLTIDNLLAAEIVTASGGCITTDADHHPDLFWAIRGGGGNFGIVTRFKFQLHNLGRVVGGMLILPATSQTITRFMEIADSAPDELTTIANIMIAPPMPGIPEEVIGQAIIMANIVWCGDVEEGQAVLQPFRDIATPITDALNVIAYMDMFPEEEVNFPMAGMAQCSFNLDHFDHSTAEEIMERMQAATAPMVVIQLRALGGAIARVPNESTAYPHRQSNYLVAGGAMYMDPSEKNVHEKWAEEFTNNLTQGDIKVYANFQFDKSENAVKAAYPGEHYNRLVKIKALYDPDNLFHVNLNFRP